MLNETKNWLDINNVKVSLANPKLLHQGFYLCQHCGCHSKECTKMYRQTGERCCSECKAESIARRK